MNGRMDRVKALLRTRDELCALSDLYADALANGRNDISTLMNRDGWEIKKQWVNHGAQAHCHYELVRERSALSSGHVEEASRSRQDIAIAKSARTAPAISGVSPLARSTSDGSAVRAGGKSLGTASQPPTVTSGVPIHGKTAAMRAQHSGSARPASYSPSREATTVIGVPARTVQQLTLAGTR